MLGAAPSYPYVAIFDSNDSGQTVGYSYVDLNGDGTGDVPHASWYDPSVNPNYAVDLNTIVSNIPGGWHIRGATAINNVGQIAVYMAPEPAPNPLNSLQAGVVDMNQNPPMLYLVPDRSFTTYSVPGDINDAGDIVVRYHHADGTVGNYAYNFNPDAGLPVPYDYMASAADVSPHINNNRDIVGMYASGDAYRLNLNGGTSEHFAGLETAAINENAAFCGAAVVSQKGNKTTRYGYVYDSAEHLFTDMAGAQDLNDFEDFIYGINLHHQRYGTLSIKSILDSRDPDAAVITSGGSLNCRAILNREPLTGFPIIVGDYNYYNNAGTSVGVTLLPVPAP